MKKLISLLIAYTTLILRQIRIEWLNGYSRIGYFQMNKILISEFKMISFERILFNVKSA